MAATVVLLTSGTSYSIPVDWNNANNSIEVFGAGGAGGGNGRYGGGGGGYSKVTNLTLTGSIPYSVGQGGAGAGFGVGNAPAGGDTYFNPTEFSNNALASDANLVSYYKLENTSDSKGANTLTNNGSGAFNPAKFANGYDQGSSNSTKYLTIGSAIIDPAGDFTIAYWMKVNTAPSSSTYRMINVEKNQTTGYVIIRYIDTAGTKTIQFNASNGSATYTGDLGTSVFQHLVFTCISGALTIYLNGVSVATGTRSNDSTTLNRSAIGAKNDGTEVCSCIFDDNQWFSRGLTAAEALSLYEQATIKAMGGNGGSDTNGTGGASTAGIGSTKFSGGNGGANGVNSGGGGGGAAGPNGAGNNGTAGTNGGAGGSGGSGDAGSGGAGGAGQNAADGTAGSPGTEYTSNPGGVTAGAGGGGGAYDTTGFNGGAGGNYGGGGGAGGVQSVGKTTGSGANGFIVITYTPANANTHLLSTLGVGS